MSGGVFGWLSALLFPPICRGCNERQSIFAPRLPGVLCPGCMKRWNEEKARACADCGKEQAQCSCVPANLRESGSDRLIHLAAYRSHQKTVPSTLILRCKDNNDREVFRFLASELAAPVNAALGVPSGDTVVTFVPRRRAAVQATGHDHAKQLASALAHEMKLPFETALRRKAWTRQQKQLDVAAREKNAERSFELCRGVTLKGKTVVLVDDVCTTGSSLAACVELLLTAGAEKVICAVVAKTEKAE